MNIEVIGMPMKYGCDVPGAELSYNAIENKLNKIFIKNNLIKKTEAILTTKEIQKYNCENGKLKYLKPIMNLNEDLYKKVMQALENKNIPISIGGDHSGAIGSISAVLDYYKGDVSIIWIDAHLDIHTDYDTPSGNIHGIPLSVCIGRCKNENLKIGEYKLKPENLFFIGSRSYEQEEKEYLEKENIVYYKDSKIKEIGINKTVNDLIGKIKTKNVHISFDFDVIKKEEFPSVNVEYTGKYISDGGLTVDETKMILVKLIQQLNICSMDFVEYNPLLDTKKEDLKKFEYILKSVDNTLK